MNRFSNLLIKSIGALTLTGLAACDYIHDDSIAPCEYRLRLVYDYNMKFADAFQREVDKAALFICDNKGNFIRRQDIEGAELKANSIAMDLEPGTYQVLVITGDRHEEKEISLAKNTNKLRVVLQDTEGYSMDVKDFSFRIVADNGYMDYDNTLLDDDTISYLPYHTESVDIAAGSADDQINGKPANQYVAVAELNTMRLMAGENYRLIVRHKDWKNDVLNVNLNQYLLLTQMEGHDIPAQEYLDRQDEYSIVFFLTPIICPDCPDPDPDPDPEPDPDPTPDPDPEIPDPEVPIVGYACYKVQVKDWVIRLNNGEL